MERVQEKGLVSEEPESPRENKEEALKLGELSGSKISENNILLSSSILDESRKSDLIDRLNNSLDQYRNVINYFAVIDRSDKIDEAKKKASEINKALKDLVKFNKDIDEFSLSLVVTPEFVTGMTREEKEEKYAEILNYYKGERNKIKLRYDSLIKKAKSLSSMEARKSMKEIKAKLEKYKNEIKKIDNTIQKVENWLSDPWMPVPSFEKIEEEEYIEKSNKDLKENEMVIILIKEENGEEYPNTVYITINLPKFLDKYSYLEKKNNKIFDEKLLFTRSEIKNIPDNVIILKLYQRNYYWYKDTYLAEKTIELFPLNTNCTYEEDITFNIDPLLNISIPKMKITVKINKALAEPEYERIIKEYMSITRVFPSFRNFNQTTDDASSKSQRSSENYHELPPEENPTKKETEYNMKKNVEKTEGNEPESIESNNLNENQFTEEEINDPNTISQLNSIKLIQNVVKEMDSRISKIEGRTPGPLKKKYLSIKVKGKVLEKSIEEGEITLDMYRSLVENQLSHDKKLMQYFYKAGKKEKVETMKVRIDLLNEEIKELNEVSQ